MRTRFGHILLIRSTRAVARRLTGPVRFGAGGSFSAPTSSPNHFHGDPPGTLLGSRRPRVGGGTWKSATLWIRATTRQRLISPVSEVRVLPPPPWFQDLPPVRLPHAAPSCPRLCPTNDVASNEMKPGDDGLSGCVREGPGPAAPGAVSGRGAASCWTRTHPNLNWPWAGRLDTSASASRAFVSHRPETNSRKPREQSARRRPRRFPPNLFLSRGMSALILGAFRDSGQRSRTGGSVSRTWPYSVNRSSPGPARAESPTGDEVPDRGEACPYCNERSCRFRPYLRPLGTSASWASCATVDWKMQDISCRDGRNPRRRRDACGEPRSWRPVDGRALGDHAGSETLPGDHSGRCAISGCAIYRDRPSALQHGAPDGRPVRDPLDRRRRALHVPGHLAPPHALVAGHRQRNREVRVHGDRPADTTVVLFREENLAELGESFPVSYARHAEVLEALASYGPRAVFVDFAFIDARSREDIRRCTRAICDLQGAREGAGLPGRARPGRRPRRGRPGHGPATARVERSRR